MNQSNQHILEYLNQYISNNNPGYAVLIKGEWGIGKTSFIKKFTDKIEEGIVNDREEEINWKPLYVSLYGISQIYEINEKIYSLIHPILSSKGTKVLARIVKGITSVAFRYNIDIIPGNNDKEEITCNVNLLDALDKDSSDGIKLKGKKILIFDDFERCRIDKQILLGYINSFVEHRSCHVIILSAEYSKKEETDNICALKEKTIGVEFTLHPEVELVVDAFIQDIQSSRKNLLLENRDSIIKVFRLSEHYNFRILRRALYDFNSCVEKIDDKWTTSPYYNEKIRSLLLNFVACYLEVLSGNKLTKEMLSLPPYFALVKDSKNRYPSDIVKKYKFECQNKWFRLLEPDDAEPILSFLQTGWFDHSKFIETLNVHENPLLPLNVYYQLSDEEYVKFRDEAIKFIYEDKCENIKVLTHYVITLLVIKSSTSDPAINLKKLLSHLSLSLKRYLKNNVFFTDDFYEEKQRIKSPLNAHRFSYDEILSNTIDKVFEAHLKDCKERIVEYLENINIENMESLFRLLQDSRIPNTSQCYSNSSIFERVNCNQFVNSFCRLNNSARTGVISVIEERYSALEDENNKQEYASLFKPEISSLQKISDLLKIKEKKEPLIQKHNSNQLALKLDNYVRIITAFSNENEDLNI